jgi:hypothetical protein
MKKLKLLDGTILESDIGHDPVTGWSIPNNVRSIEFEDGTILENQNFDLETCKQNAIKPLQAKIIDLQIRIDAGVKNSLDVSELQSELNSLKTEIRLIEAL